MIRLMKSEMIKLSKSFPLKTLFALMLGLSVVSSLSSLSYVGSPAAEEMDIALTGFDAFFSSLRDTPTISMIGMIVIGLTVCGDFENRTIQMQIAAGYNRPLILFSKLFAVTIAYIAVYLPYPLGRAILQSILIGFGAPVTFATIGRMPPVFLAVLIVGMALNGAVFMLAFVIRKTAIVLGVGFVAVVLGGNALLSFGAADPALGGALSMTPLGLIKALAIANYPPGLLMQACVTGLICLALFVFATYLLFRKAELK